MNPAPTSPNSSDEAVMENLINISHQLGSNTSLVLQGGGNTSVKTTMRDVVDGEVQTLLVKGSGWSLSDIEPEGFVPLRLDRLLALTALDDLDDDSMVGELRRASLKPSAPDASIEALLHATLPATYVLHSHADAIVALTDRNISPAEIERVLGSNVLVVEYVKPGFALARRVAKLDIDEADAIVLMNHGLFTFSNDAEIALSRHLELVARAAHELGINSPRTDALPNTESEDSQSSPEALVEIADLRNMISQAANHPMILRQSKNPAAKYFSTHPEIERLAKRGTATPEHVLYTKREPLIGRDVEGYAVRYREYVERNLGRASTNIVELDPAPRVVFDPELGMLSAGETDDRAQAAEEIALHTIDIINAADRHGGYQSLNESDTFDIEYWSLEQAKLGKRSTLPLDGEIALVTGAASGIGRAIAKSLQDCGAVVVGIDLSAAITAPEAAVDLGVRGDAGNPETLNEALARTIERFGGLDIVVIAAGIFPPSSLLSDLPDAVWERALSVNATAPMRVMRASHPYLSLSPRGGRVVLVSTKNVAAPGPGAAAYSVSKAAAAQLARVAALEWAAQGIRVNQVDPDAVFDTGIWTPELIAERAANYGLTPEQYRRRNLLGAEVGSADVAEAVLAFCTGLHVTTGAHLTVDGGNERVV